MRKLIIAMGVCVATVTAVPAFAEEEDFVDQLQDYLDLAEQYVDLANRPEAAVFFAVEGIVEIHEARGEKAKAAELLAGMIDQFPDNPAARNIIRFELRDLHAEMGDADAALAQLQAVIEDNR
ncbi:MAG: hypothetical protein AAF940_02145 [Pseudomonadota bacterium]